MPCELRLQTRQPTLHQPQNVLLHARWTLLMLILMRERRQMKHAICFGFLRGMQLLPLEQHRRQQRPQKLLQLLRAGFAARQ